jgi:hypothetical protein
MGFAGMPRKSINARARDKWFSMAVTSNEIC